LQKKILSKNIDPKKQERTDELIKETREKMIAQTGDNHHELYANNVRHHNWQKI
jgi:hypothetical protein